MMDRLTQRWGRVPAVPTEFNMDFVFNIPEKDYQGFTKLLNRLADYEDTGLTPDEIMDGRLLTGWISVEEKLPSREEYLKNDGRFIVTDGMRVEGSVFDIYADGYNDPKWLFPICQPIAWMPLPEPPKGDESK